MAFCLPPPLSLVETSERDFVPRGGQQQFVEVVVFHLADDALPSERFQRLAMSYFCLQQQHHAVQTLQRTRAVCKRLKSAVVVCNLVRTLRDYTATSTYFIQGDTCNLASKHPQIHTRSHKHSFLLWLTTCFLALGIACSDARVRRGAP